MGATSYDPRKTALLIVDPYNDFLSEGGKLWPLIKAVADEVGLLDVRSQRRRYVRAPSGVCRGASLVHAGPAELHLKFTRSVP
jgi:hypothetical protein